MTHIITSAKPNMPKLTTLHGQYSIIVKINTTPETYPD